MTPLLTSALALLVLVACLGRARVAHGPETPIPAARMKEGSMETKKPIFLEPTGEF
ncbi:MAG: hypothetical protein IT330_00950 [Anaerolineae bacterium]|nr:hypothetical protein [Anaerolineae bacterium]